MAVEADLVPPPAPVELPAPVPAPEREYPKIELKRDNYELLRLLMTKDGLGRPGTVPWTDIIKIFGDIGFSDAKVGRASRGGLWTFTPKDELKEAQVSHMLRVGVSMLCKPQAQGTPTCTRLNHQFSHKKKCLELIKISLGYRKSNIKRSAS